RHGNGVGLGSRSSYQPAERRVSIGSHFAEMGLRYQARSKTGSQRDRPDGGGEHIGAVRRARGREVRQRASAQPRTEKQVRTAAIDPQSGPRVIREMRSAYTCKLSPRAPIEISGPD